MGQDAGRGLWGAEFISCGVLGAQGGGSRVGGG